MKWIPYSTGWPYPRVGDYIAYGITGRVIARIDRVFKEDFFSCPYVHMVVIKPTGITCRFNYLWNDWKTVPSLRPCYGRPLCPKEAL